MAYGFLEFKNKVDGVSKWLAKEFSSIRTGRATVTLFDNVMVESYGSKIPLNQSANISVEDPRTIRVKPFDKSIVSEIEKGISKADLGVSTAVDGEGVRVIFPELTTENRERLIKSAKAKVEEAKISLRNERNKVSKGIDEKKQTHEISDDDSRRYKGEMQKIVDEASRFFDELEKKKEKEIMS